MPHQADEDRGDRPPGRAYSDGGAEESIMTKAPTIITAGYLLVVLAIVVACGAPTTPTPNNPISFQTFLIGQNSGLRGNEAAAFKIETQAQWVELWSTHQSNVFPTTAPPTFPFEGQMLIAVFDREQPTGGFAIEIQALRSENTAVIIEAVRSIPGPNCGVTLSLTRPFHIVSTDALTGDLQLAVTDNVTSC